MEPVNPGTYSTLSPGSRESPLQFSDPITLSDIHSGSNENLISSKDVADGVMHGRTTSKPPLAAAHGYEIPVSSQENLVSVGLDIIGDLQATKEHTSSTSGHNSSNIVSPVTATSSLPHTSQSSTNGSTRTSNSQNPQWKYYEDPFSPDSTSSFHDSPTISGRVDWPGPQQTHVPTAHIQQNPPRFDGNQPFSAGGSTISLSSQVSRQVFKAQFQSIDNMTLSSDEPPPPYSSRPSSEFVLDRDGDDSSMLHNGAYEGAIHLQHPWYQDSGPSIDSRNGSATPTTSQTTNSTVERLQPYAMIQNEHIPYHSFNQPTSVPEQPPNVPTSRRVSNHRRPSLPNGNSTSTLC